MSSSLWDRTVGATIYLGERILAPIERWIGRRSLVGNDAFLPAERFPWIEDIPRAQQLFQEQLTVNWTEKLQPFAQRLNPLHEEIFRNYPSAYY